MKRPGHIVDSNNVEQTRRLGRRIGRALRGGEVVALVGRLGAGKTQLVKGIAVGNGTQDWARVTSPTFTLVHEHAGQVCLYHVDAYRLSSGDELAALGLEEMIGPASAVVIEWAEKVAKALPADRLTVRFETTGESSRRLTLEAAGPSSQTLLERVLNDRS